MAFSSESLVMIWLGRRSRSSTSTTSRPHSTATLPFLPSSAGTIELPIGEMPSTSKAIAIVLAVNWPPQAPAPGDATSSSSVSSSSVHVAGRVRAHALEHVLDRHVLALVAPGAIEPP